MSLSFNEALADRLRRYIPLCSAADLCDRSARAFPDKEALIDRRNRLRWSEVKELSDKLALALRDLGLGKDRPLLVQLPNCVELYLARLACEKAGVACVTVSPLFRKAELKPILEHTRPGAVLILRSYRGTDFHRLIFDAGAEGLAVLMAGEEVTPDALSVDQIFRSKIDREKTERLLAGTRLTLFDSCQIATTSGSTGPPKCVEILIYTRLLTASIHSRRFGLGHDDTIAAFAPIVSGTSEALGYFGTALLGARVVLVDHFDAESALERMATEGVTFACMVPTMVAKITGVRRGPVPDALKGIVTYGSRLPASLAERTQLELRTKIVQAYGTTDYGGISATYIEDDDAARLQTVGPPLEGNEVIICGDDGRPLPTGEIGNIRVRGLHAVGRYYRSPQLDQEKWIGGYFDLGEIGRFDDRGNLIVLGRSDHVIVRGGQNIYPEDVENLLLQHPNIEEAAVIGVPDPILGEKVCAFVSLRQEGRIELGEVVGFLKGFGLASFKLPERLEILPELPRVPSGQKVDRDALARRAQRMTQDEDKGHDRA